MPVFSFPARAHASYVGMGRKYAFGRAGADIHCVAALNVRFTLIRRRAHLLRERRLRPISRRVLPDRVRRLLGYSGRSNSRFRETLDARFWPAAVSGRGFFCSAVDF